MENLFMLQLDTMTAELEKLPMDYAEFKDSVILESHPEWMAEYFRSLNMLDDDARKHLLDNLLAADKELTPIRVKHFELEMYFGFEEKAEYDPKPFELEHKTELMAHWIVHEQIDMVQARVEHLRPGWYRSGDYATSVSEDGVVEYWKKIE